MKTRTGISAFSQLCCAFVAACALHVDAFAQTATSQLPTLDAAVQQATATFLHDPHHVGLSIGIIQNGARHTYHFGSTDRATSQLPNDKSIYEIASVTKTYTGILLAQALMDGKINLTDDVQKYLPEPYPNLAYMGFPVRIIDLATSTSGLPKHIRAYKNGMTEQQFLASYGDYTDAKFLQDLKQMHVSDFPGTRFEYSNVGAQLMGIVLERVYKMSYAELVEKYITKPNDMPDTMTVLPADKQDRLVKEYDGKGERMPELAFWRSVPAAGGLKSTIADQLNYLQWNLDEFSPVVALSHRSLFSSTTEHDDAIAMFWLMHTMSDGSRLIRHAGGGFGSTSYCALYPDAHFAIVLLANDADASTETALTAIADQIYSRVVEQSSAN